MNVENTDTHHSIDTNSMDINQTNTIKPSGTNVNNLWNYMEKQINEKAKCGVCGVILSRKNGATTGLRKHLHQVHKLQAFGITSTKLRSKSCQLLPEQKKKLDTLIIKCIIEDGRSFSDMGQSGILKVFNHLVEGYVPPHRNTVQRNLKQFESEQKELLIKELANVQSLGITCDFWSDKRLQSYMCLTGHYISSNNQFISKILSFTSFHHRHFSSNISMIIKNELKELNIFEKTRSITTDGAANMLKAAQMLGGDIKQIYCIAHRLHLVICNGLGFWIRKKRESSSSVVPTISNNTDEIDSDEEDLTDDIQVVPQSPQANNSSNMIASSDQSLLTTNQNCNINHADAGVSGVSIDEESDEFIMDIMDNWSIDIIEYMDPSAYDSIQQHIVEGMLMYKKIIYKINSEKYDIGLNKKQTTKLSLIELDQEDWKILELIEFVLKPVVHATELVSGSQYPTIGMSYFVIFQIREFLEDINDHTVHDWKILYYLKSLLLKQVQKYFFDNHTQLKTIQMHSYFDPIAFGCLTRREQRECESNLIELDEQLADEEVIDEVDVNEIQLQTNTQRKSVESKSSSMNKFINSIGKTFLAPSSLSSIVKSNKKKLMEEMSVYRSLAQREYNSIVNDEKYSNPMEFWNMHRSQFKYLYKYATYHLVTPATSVASESAFSTASYLFRKQRSRLTPENLSSTMFLKDKIDSEFNI
ncbi:unnamed protein product [Rotaria socialis]|uniref:BED-type domain-containing protein n=2 Tax=Rotaria TaxID=231623 RepID=A0A818G5Y5_9BILA|nr:unnamed protein product [Rotaria socialis]CAF3483671.1 unnamed protein product [Rotaria socialis]CAF3528070.1 unnamed protein product [Rotaria socialis]CAF4535126.1 unnamed protein product [Rotaria socialis]CAF4652161.1 unnamed protein product [Rotaria socialis]